MPPTPILANVRRKLLIAVLSCCLLARIAVPAGWMPMIAPDGGIVLSPCSGMGAMKMAGRGMPGMGMAGMSMPGGHVTPAAPDRHPDPSGDHPCSGAGMSVALEAPAIAPLAATAVARAAVRPVRMIPLIGRGLAAPPPPATGPPALA